MEKEKCKYYLGTIDECYGGYNCAFEKQGNICYGVCVDYVFINEDNETKQLRKSLNVFYKHALIDIIIRNYRRIEMLKGILNNTDLKPYHQGELEHKSADWRKDNL